MKYQVVKVRIRNGQSVPDASQGDFTRLQAGTWQAYEHTYLKMGHFGSMRVFFPATFQGVSLRFKDTYDVAQTPDWAGAEDDAYLGEVTDAQTWAGKSRTINAEVFTADLLVPVLVDSGGNAQAQSQDTELIFVLKANG